MKTIFSFLAFQFFSIFPLLAILDTNNNGLSDVWEKQYNTSQLFSATNTTHAATADPDQDGWTNAQEALAGTNPFSANQFDGRSHIALLPSTSQGLFSLQIPTKLGKNYQIQGSYDLLSWINIDDKHLALEPNHTALTGTYTTEGTPALRYFWRTNISDADSDLDDLTDHEEHTLGTNPYHNDSDNDGIHDKAELLRTLDPLNYDSDNDQLGDGYEDSISTNPNNPDTDNDTINDGDEVAQGTNPLLADTDGDGISDAQEKIHGTNPTLTDTDGDGTPDGLEITNNMNPLSNDSDLDGILDTNDITPNANNAIADPDGSGLSNLLNSHVAPGKLIGRYDFEQLSSGNFLSSIPGQASASAQFIGTDFFTMPTGMPSHCCVFATAPINQHLRLPTSIIHGEDSHVVSYWLKLPENVFTTPGTGVRSLFSFGKGSIGLPSLHWYIDLQTQKIKIDTHAIGPDLGVAKPIVSGWTIPQAWNDGKWHHIVMYKNQKDYKFYFDGVNLGTISSTNILASLNALNDFTLIGSRDLATATSFNANFGFWPGARLDRLRVYKTLTDAEVIELYQQDMDRDGIPDRIENTTSYWRDANGNGFQDLGEKKFILDPYHRQPTTQDSDNDGLSDANELTHGTDPGNPDTDGDLMPDGWEKQYNLNPLSAADANLDPDNDGLTNINEYRYNTNPTIADTDGDGKNDGQEATGSDGNVDTDDGSNPNDPTDGGNRPPATDLLTLKLGVGDRSVSKSEDYVLNVFEIQPDGSEKRIYTLRSGGYGEYKEETRSFPRDKTYTFQIDWQRTNNATKNPGTSTAEGADFDYHFVVQPLSGNQSHTLLDAYDPKTKTIDPANKLLDPQDINPSDDNDDNVVNFLTTHEPKRVVLLRAAFLVDANRDGQFSKEDEGKITNEKPWRIWINDDNDWHETGGNDIPNADSGNRDCSNSYIDQVRDLVDFFPVTLQLQQALKLFPKESYRYTIAHQGHPVFHPAFKVAWVPTHSLTNSFGSCDKHHKDITYAHAITKLATNSVSDYRYGRHIPDEMLHSLEQGNGIILLEGCVASDKTIQLKIRKTSDNSIVHTISLPTRISKVEDMYRSKWLEENLAGGSQGGLPSEPPAYPDSETNGKTFIFVDGYNVSVNNSRGWHSELFKRMHQSGSRARFLGVIWRGNESQVGSVTPDFWRNVHNAFRTSKSLADFANGISGEKTISAFSLGNVMVSSAIQDHGMQVSKYFLIDAAVPREAYSGSRTEDEENLMRNPAWQGYNKRLWASNWHARFPANHACHQKVKWKGRFAAFPNAYNFYSTGEEVLKHSEGTEPTISLSGLRAWTKQEMTKGFGFLSGGGIGHVHARGGWEWNQYWFTRDYTVEPDGLHYSAPRVRTPTETTSITDEQLRTNPFFEPFHFADFHNAAKQEAAANNYDEVSKLLAESIPALSHAAGSTLIEAFTEERNFDMNTLYKNGWPASRNDETGWHHSDIREMSFLYIYGVFHKFCELAALRNP